VTVAWSEVRSEHSRLEYWLTVVTDVAMSAVDIVTTVTLLKVEVMVTVPPTAVTVNDMSLYR
jgi:hypothetical protein